MYTAVIILNYNNWEDTINCIESVEEHNSASIRYIVVDNGSTRERCIDALESFFIKRFSGKYKKIYDTEVNESPLPYLTFLVSQRNDGYARGNNKGLHLAYTDKNVDYIMILNNDILFVEDIIPRLNAISRVLPKCAIVSPVLYKKGMQELDYNCARINKSTWYIILSIIYTSSKSAEKKQILKVNPTLINEQYVPIDLPSGACMYVNKELMMAIGGFDSHTFLYYEEDILYSKIKKIGLNNYIVPYLRCIHLGASSTKRKSSSFLVRTAFESRKYYLKNYCNLSVFQSFVLKLLSFYVQLLCFVLEKRRK